MKREFLIAIRNGEGQILVLEDLSYAPVFPGGLLPGVTGNPSQITDQVRAQTGLSISGLYLCSATQPSKNRQVSLYSAFVDGGKLHTFPTAKTIDVEGYRSASWIAPTIAQSLEGTSPAFQKLVTELLWLQRETA